MKSFMKFLCAGTIAIYVAGCNPNANDELSHHHHHHDHEAGHNHEQHDADHHHDEGEEKEENHKGVIVLEPETAELMGVKTAIVKAEPFSEVIKVSGVITDAPNGAGVVSAPVSGTVTFAPGITQGSSVGTGSAIATVSTDKVAGGNANLAAKAALDAARRELDRLKPLYEDRLVTASDYNAAVRAYDEARANYSSAAASGRAIAPCAGVITTLKVSSGQYVNAGDPIATVSSNKKLTLRADVPQRYYASLKDIDDARIRLPYGKETVALSSLGGKRVAAAASASSDVPGYVPVYFTFDNDGSLVRGAGAEVYLLGRSGAPVISVPVGALSEQQGRMFVFVRLDEDCYRKTPVT
ncbi:MAG: efflux RND transporter periplasmic adaptor subunit, partial [Muribaculaceae bacterium]